MTDDMESRLTDAMQAQARDIEPADEHASLDRIAARVRARRRRGVIVLGVAAALAVLAGSLVLLRRGDDRSNQVHVTSDSPSSFSSTASSSSEPTTTLAPTTSTPTTNVTTSTVTVPPTPPPAFIWPPYGGDGRQGYDTPEDAAHFFFAEYLGMTGETLGQTVHSPDGTTVEGFARGPGSARTLVDVADSSAGWVVIGARADEIEVDAPQPHDPVNDPLTVSGRSVAFEAQLGLEVRPLASMSAVANGTAMGGSTEMQPFSTTLSVPTDYRQLVLIVFEGDASGAQTYAKATVVMLGPDR